MKILVTNKYREQKGDTVEIIHQVGEECVIETTMPEKYTEWTIDNPERAKEILTDKFKGLVKDVTDAVDMLIQSKIDEYNHVNNVYIQDINSVTKYALQSKSKNYQFALQIIEWVSDVWETARQIQAEVIAGTKKVHTIQELIGMLPEFKYVSSVEETPK